MRVVTEQIQNDKEGLTKKISNWFCETISPFAVTWSEWILRNTYIYEYKYYFNVKLKHNIKYSLWRTINIFVLQGNANLEQSTITLTDITFYYFCSGNLGSTPVSCNWQLHHKSTNKIVNDNVAHSTPLSEQALQGSQNNRDAFHSKVASTPESTIHEVNAWGSSNPDTKHPTLKDDEDDTNSQHFDTTPATTPLPQEKRKHSDKIAIKDLNQTPEHSKQPHIKSDSQSQQRKQLHWQ